MNNVKKLRDKSKMMKERNIKQHAKDNVMRINNSIKPTEKNKLKERVNIKRGRVESFVIYEVSDSELSIIEKGSTNSNFLIFANSLLSIAFSFFISLFSTNFDNKQITMITFIVLTVVGFIGGVILLILWYKIKNDFKITLHKIKGRIKE